MKCSGWLKAISVAFVITLFLAPPARAQEEPLPDRFRLEIGGYFLTSLDTSAELFRKVGPIDLGGRVDFNKDLGLADRKNVLRLDGFYRFGLRSSIDFSYWRIDRDSTTTVGRDIEFGEIEIPAGEAVSSFYETQTIRASYKFSLYNVPKAEIGVSFGLHTTLIDLGIACISCPTNLSESASFPAPLPVIGFNLRYQINRRWQFAGYSQHFLLEVGGFDGSMTDTRVHFSHHTFRNVGFGFGWNRITTDMSVDVNDYFGSIDTNMDGLQAFLVLSFGNVSYPSD
jgi:hypothetical protein